MLKEIDKPASREDEVTDGRLNNPLTSTRKTR